MPAILTLGRRLALVGLALGLVAAAVWAGEATSPATGGEPSDLPVGTMLMGLLGGVAIFLYGMDQMAEGLKKLAGDSLRKVLGGLTRNRVLGVGTGLWSRRSSSPPR